MTDHTTTTADELLAGYAEAGLDETLVDQMAAVVQEDPSVVTDSASGIDPASITTPQLGLVKLLLDNSISMQRLLGLLAAGHDEFIQALYPSAREGTTILASASLLSGHTLYPFTRIDQVPLFGRQPHQGEATLPGLDLVYESGATKAFEPLIEHTPLLDRIRQMLTAGMAEAVRYENPLSNRTVDQIGLVITDGLDTGSTLDPATYRQFIEEMDDTGSVTLALMYVGKIPDQGIDPQGYKKERDRILNYLGRRFAGLPASIQDMTLTDILQTYFGQLGIRQDRLFLPGGDPRAIRRAVGQASDLAMQASQGALRDTDV